MEIWFSQVIYGESPFISGQTGGGLWTAWPTMTRHMVNYLDFWAWICDNISAQPERSGSNVAELRAGGARVSRAKRSIIVGLSQLDDRWGLMKWVSSVSQAWWSTSAPGPSHLSKHLGLSVVYHGLNQPKPYLWKLISEFLDERVLGSQIGTLGEILLDQSFPY